MDRRSLDNGRHRRVFAIAMGLSAVAHAAVLGLVSLSPGDAARHAESRQETATEAPDDWARRAPMQVVEIREPATATPAGEPSRTRPDGAAAAALPGEPVGLDAGGSRMATATVAPDARPVAVRSAPPVLLASTSAVETRMDRAVEAYRERMEARSGRRSFDRDEPRARIRGGFGRGGIGGPGCSSPPFGGTDRGIGDYFPGR